MGLRNRPFGQQNFDNPELVSSFDKADKKGVSLEDKITFDNDYSISKKPFINYVNVINKTTGKVVYDIPMQQIVVYNRDSSNGIFIGFGITIDPNLNRFDYYCPPNACIVFPPYIFNDYTWSIATIENHYATKIISYPLGGYVPILNPNRFTFL